MKNNQFVISSFGFGGICNAAGVQGLRVKPAMTLERSHPVRDVTLGRDAACHVCTEIQHPGRDVMSFSERRHAELVSASPFLSWSLRVKPAMTVRTDSNFQIFNFQLT